MDHDEFAPARRIPVTGLVAGLAAALVVAGLAFGAGWSARGVDRVEVTRPPTAQELEVACTPEVTEVEDQLTTAQSRVSELEREVATTQSKVTELESRQVRNADAGRSQRAELEALRAELATTKAALVVAEAEKERLLVELSETKGELADTRVVLAKTAGERDKAREDALFNRWNQFLADAQLEICEKGNRKKLGGCRETVEATLASAARRDAFSHCVRSGQAVPMVRELGKGGSLPQFAEMMNEDAKQVKGWYVELCDPTLPERDDAQLAEGRLPPTRPAPAG